MAPNQKLKHPPSANSAFNKRITTLKGLQDALGEKSTCFLALDTEHVDPNILHQVGLAFTQTLESPHQSDTCRPCIQEFFHQNQIRALTLNVKISQKEEDGLGIPVRSPHRFGQEQQVDLDGLEDVIISFIKNSAYQDGNNLILVGFGLSTEWRYLMKHFPKAAPYFSSWLDVRDIAQDITSLGNIPGLKKLLYLFRYDWKTIKNRNADNAGDDAVFTLAAAIALLSPANQQKLVLNQHYNRPVDIYTRRKGFLVKGMVEHPFAAKVECEAGLPLPQSIGTGLRLASQFITFEPESAGIMNRQTACLTFRTYDALERFIQAADGLVLPTSHKLTAQHMKDAAERHAETEAKRATKRRDKQALRAMQKSGNTAEKLYDKHRMWQNELMLAKAFIGVSKAAALLKAFQFNQSHPTFVGLRGEIVAAAVQNDCYIEELIGRRSYQEKHYTGFTN